MSNLESKNNNVWGNVSKAVKMQRMELKNLMGFVGNSKLVFLYDLSNLALVGNDLTELVFVSKFKEIYERFFSFEGRVAYLIISNEFRDLLRTFKMVSKPAEGKFSALLLEESKNYAFQIGKFYFEGHFSKRFTFSGKNLVLLQSNFTDVFVLVEADEKWDISYFDSQEMTLRSEKEIQKS